jgi:predicted CoA-substrate-specific enzyme activase
MRDERMVLGVDIGSVAVGYVLVDGRGQIRRAGYQLHHGQIMATTTALLKGVPPHELRYLAATTSTPAMLATQRRYNDQIAYIAAAKAHHPDMGALLIVGGEKFSLSTFDGAGNYIGSTTNTSCAAGTGSFLDQQASRLHLGSSENLAAIAGSCQGQHPKIASRCAVFAKTDLIHAQQHGYRLEEISNGLCHGLAKNLVDVLFSGNPEIPGTLIFCGGVAKNLTVAKHIENLSGLCLTIPENGHLYGALGAALLLLEELNHDGGNGLIPAADPLSLTHLFHAEQSHRRLVSSPPLVLQRSSYPDFAGREHYTTRRHDDNPEVEVDIYVNLSLVRTAKIFLGIDIGSTSTKAVLLDGDRDEVVAGLYTRTAGRPVSAVQDIFFAIAEIEARCGFPFNIKRCATTGSGRKFIGKLVGADTVVDEITAHARAAFTLCPEVDTIIEIGGQDAKFTLINNGRVTFSTMNSVCAAGTGSFIEEQAARLGCPIGDYSRRAENRCAPPTSDCCTVFMERDINHLLSEGYEVDEVLAAALHSVRENYLQKVATEKLIGKTVLFQGATAKNRALVAAFEQRLGKPILVSKYCHLTGALGAALILTEELPSRSHFIGLDLCHKKVALTTSTCDFCNNHCKISTAIIDGRKTSYGFLCGRDGDDLGYVARISSAFDLLRERKRLRPKSPEFPAATPKPIVGLPAAVHLYSDLYLWQTFFRLLGISTITSEKAGNPVAVGKKLSRAEFCSPVAAMHGHVRWLLDRADYIFLPLYLENKVRSGRRHFCYYTQFLPALVGDVAPGEEKRLLRPIVKYLYTPFHTKMQLYRMLQQVSPGQWNFFEVSSAYDRAVESDQDYRRRLKDALHRRSEAKEKSEIGVVFLGRPYTLLSPSLNNNIPRIFHALGIDAFFQDMLDYEPQEVEDLKPLLEEIHWEHGARILEGAEVVARRPGLYPVLVTSFKCSPDSFAIEYFKKIMERHDKPYLILSLDGHDSSVGYETRIEAAIRAFRNHHHHHRPAGIKAAPAPPPAAISLAGKDVLFPNWDQLTCTLLTATLQREGYSAHLLEETEHTLRDSLRHNSGQCIPLNAIAEAAMVYVRKHQLDPANCVLWINRSSLACNIRLYPLQIGNIFKEHGGGLEKITIYQGEITFADISLRAARNAYFAYMLGGMLQRVACRIRPYETEKGRTDKILNKAIRVLTDAFLGKRPLEKTVDEIVSQFEWIETAGPQRPKVAIFGDLYSRDNRIMNQDLIATIEAYGGEVVTTPYSEFGKMIANSYFRKWFNEGKYLDMLTGRALLTAMQSLEKNLMKTFNRLLDETEHHYDDAPAEILARYQVSIENSGESMDNILKVHYLAKQHPDLSLFVQASPALCCASLITEAMRTRIEHTTGIPVVSITYDGTRGSKNDLIGPYLKFPRQAAPCAPRLDRNIR